MSAPAQGAEIQEHVERLLASPGFRIPARRARLLRYLAERAVAGRCEQINEYSIGVDVFERPESFDPKTDAVVRADVSRLRQNLKEYYSGQGRADSMVLELPARSYIPSLGRSRRRQMRTGQAVPPLRGAVGSGSPRQRASRWLPCWLSSSSCAGSPRELRSRRPFLWPSCRPR